jgi:hypothetical protein
MKGIFLLVKMNGRCYFLLILLLFIISILQCSRITDELGDKSKQSPISHQEIISKIKAVYNEMEEFTKTRRERDLETAKLYKKRDLAMQRYLKGLNVQVVDGHDKV